MLVNKGFLLFELVCALAIAIGGIQVLLTIQTTSLRITGTINKYRNELLKGATLLEYKEVLGREKIVDKENNLKIEQHIVNIQAFLPQKGKNSYYAVSRKMSYVTIKYNNDIILVG